jgi:hypothetical protein
LQYTLESIGDDITVVIDLIVDGARSIVKYILNEIKDAFMALGGLLKHLLWAAFEAAARYFGPLFDFEKIYRIK